LIIKHLTINLPTSQFVEEPSNYVDDQFIFFVMILIHN
jgi:hypothetical protein